MKDIVFRSGDRPLFSMNAQVRGMPVDLTTGYTINFLFQCGAGVAQSREATITDPDDPLGGLAEYRLLSGDLVAVSGEVDFWWEWALIDADGNPSSGPQLRRHATVISRLAEIPASPDLGGGEGSSLMGLLW